LFGFLKKKIASAVGRRPIRHKNGRGVFRTGRTDQALPEENVGGASQHVLFFLKCNQPVTIASYHSYEAESRAG